MTQIETEELEAIVNKLDEEAPWATVSNVLDHAGWLDLVTTIRDVWPEAYEAMRRDVMGDNHIGGAR
jgi:hypothetical protein